MSKKNTSQVEDIVKQKVSLLINKSINFNDFVKEFSFLPIEKTSNYLDFIRFCGLNFYLDSNNNITLQTRFNNIKNEIFCVVDIETNGHSIQNGGHIIEIGAVKYQNGVIIDSFKSLINIKYIPQQIVELTGIDMSMVKNAPSIHNVLYDFRVFLSDSVFVAHNVSFDYGFISKWYEKIGLPPLLNRRLCTLDLARRCIPAPKHGLESLKHILNIENTHHRALNDALSAAKVLEYCVNNCLPVFVKTTEELIAFSKTKTTKIIKQEKTFKAL